MTRSYLGFSLIESLMTMAVLGFGVTALLKMHVGAQTGMRWSRLRTTATHIALQRAELLATKPAGALPNCQGPTSCRRSFREYEPPLTNVGNFPCTQYLGDMELSLPESQQGTGVQGLDLRVDTVVSAPAGSQQADARTLTISVCWTGDKGRIELIQAKRLLLPEN